MQDNNQIDNFLNLEKDEIRKEANQIPIIYQYSYTSEEEKALEELKLYYGKNPEKLKDHNVHLKNKNLDR